jgi:hypothetical protein
MFAQLLLAGAALAAQDCPRRLSADDLRAELADAEDALAQRLPSAGPALVELIALLGCVDGPLFEEDLGALFLARGVSLYSADKDKALDVLMWAASLGASWPEDFGGSTVREVYQGLEGRVGSPATLALQAAGGVDVVLVDGWVTPAGEHPLAPGAHLVQWREDGEWSGQLVVVKSGATLAAGPAPSERARAPGEPGPTWGAVALGMRFYQGLIYDGYQEWDGGAWSPSLLLEGRLSPRSPWFLDADLALGAPARDERPPMASGVGALGGARLGDDAWIELALGGRAAVLPAVGPGLPGDAAPVFSESWRVGAAGQLGLGATDGPVGAELELAAAWYGPAWDATGCITGSLRLEQLEPLMRARGGFMGVEAARGAVSQYAWFGVEAGARWRLP